MIEGWESDLFPRVSLSLLMLSLVVKNQITTFGGTLRGVPILYYFTRTIVIINNKL